MKHSNIEGNRTRLCVVGMKQYFIENLQEVSCNLFSVNSSFVLARCLFTVMKNHLFIEIYGIRGGRAINRETSFLP